MNSKIISAPWNEEQIAALKLRQSRLDIHPYTCVEHFWKPLTPTHKGWVCTVEFCNYTQDWALATDAPKEK